MSEEVPQLGWKHIAYDIIGEAIHLHIQEAIEYRGLRFHWTLDTKTSERRSLFFIKDKEFETLNEAIANWKPPKKKRVRL